MLEIIFMKTLGNAAGSTPSTPNPAAPLVLSRSDFVESLARVVFDLTKGGQVRNDVTLCCLQDTMTYLLLDGYNILLYCTLWMIIASLATQYDSLYCLFIAMTLSSLMHCRWWKHWKICLPHPLQIYGPESSRLMCLTAAGIQ